MNRSVLIGLVVLVLVAATAGVVVVTVMKVKQPAAPPPTPQMPTGPMAGPSGAPLQGPAGLPGAGTGMGPGGGGGGGVRQGAMPFLQQAGGTEEDMPKLEAFNERRRELTDGLREASQTLRETTADESASDEQVLEALAALEAHQEETKAGVQAAQKELETDLDLASRPRLKAALTLAGILGESVPGGSGRMGGGGRWRGQGGAGPGGQRGFQPGMGGGQGGQGGGPGPAMGGGPGARPAPVDGE